MSLKTTFELPLGASVARCTIEVPLESIGATYHGGHVDVTDNRIGTFLGTVGSHLAKGFAAAEAATSSIATPGSTPASSVSGEPEPKMEENPTRQTTETSIPDLTSSLDSKLNLDDIYRERLARMPRKLDISCGPDASPRSYIHHSQDHGNHYEMRSGQVHPGPASVQCDQLDHVYSG
jgi:hypothetical protein